VFSTAEWIDATTIVLDAAPYPGGKAGDGMLDAATLPDAHPARLTVAQEPGCRLQEPAHPFRLPNALLGYVNECLGQGSTSRFTLFSRALDSTSVMRLGTLDDYAVNNVTSAPDGRRFLFGSSSGICAGIAYAGIDHVEFLPPTSAGTGNHAFRVDQAITTAPCDTTGRAEEPDWSPDGARVAMMVSPASVGVSGPARIDEPWDLVLMPAAGGDPLITLVSGISRPTGLSWSPDGRWIAYSQSREGNAAGTYLVEVVSRRVIRISPRVFSGPSWSPDGQSIVGLLRGESGLQGGWLVIADVTVAVGAGN